MKFVLINTVESRVPEKHKADNAAVEELLAEDFNRLSVDDRLKIAQEIDGCHSMEIAESPELLENSLVELSSELDAIPFKKKVAYLQSQKLNRTYINDPDFRLRFLRAELFNAREAAVRLVKYCDFVLELFGSFALERNIRFNDFSKKEIRWMQMGYIQLMPYRDRSGRRVILQIIDSNVFVEMESRLKIYHYMMSTASTDVETQKKGVVLIVWPGGPANEWKVPRNSDSRIGHLSSKRHEVVPVRYVAVHYCLPDNPVFRLLRSFAILYGGRGKGIKSRMKVHVGDDIELRYIMQGYGIPVDYIPVTGTGNIKIANHKQWTKVQRLVEDTEGLTIVECPRSSDVVFKPGKRMLSHPGNLLFERLIQSKADKYAPSTSKRDLYRWLMKEILKDRGGRFLKWEDDGYWAVLHDESKILTKIATSCKAVLRKWKQSQRQKQSMVQVESTPFVFQPQSPLGNNGPIRKRPLDDCIGGELSNCPCDRK